MTPAPTDRQTQRGMGLRVLIGCATSCVALDTFLASGHDTCEEAQRVYWPRFYAWIGGME